MLSYFVYESRQGKSASSVLQRVRKNRNDRHVGQQIPNDDAYPNNCKLMNRCSRGKILI